VYRNTKINAATHAAAGCRRRSGIFRPGIFTITRTARRFSPVAILMIDNNWKICRLNSFPIDHG